ncbi:MAG: tetratricopeptide repeat protein [Marinobacter sp.]|uniref:tetratricopeptide repeat protein n=1 Tax=Marinobacter sp. TaxID=50741 RepID=UPI00299D3FF3|nr:tetratricopeptide repeat protein [Marinobacter sp.]MDX1634254.1 tetratricopeptide repeat protein [Marinobacter sp.]
MGLTAPVQADDQQTEVAREMIQVLDAYTVYKMGQFELAFERYLKLARAGSRQGMLNVGNMYAQGLGVPQSHENALYWYRKSAEAGDAISMAEVARAYEEGLGVAPDPELAMSWYRRSAEKDNPDAQWVVGRAMYQQGQHQEGLAWIRKAAQQGGQPSAQQFLAGLSTTAAGDSALTAERRDAVLATLARMDLAIQRGQPEEMLALLAPDADIRVRLPDANAWQTLNRAELVALWQATFDRAQDYRYQRLAPELSRGGELVRADSLIREWFGTGPDAPQLEILEVAELEVIDGKALIQRLQLDIRRVDGSAAERDPGTQ